ncbi:MAG: hypothetical protein A3G18_00785 [Rhodospirillales bacterium RIFCSPLOWO2_12_FULL_58_28]|nr:MAG: hypothetical protein A3G18_00785 [Rhodospirillales bacterium RIFCSPLOWO2_12_FULL_58_28]
MAIKEHIKSIKESFNWRWLGVSITLILIIGIVGAFANGTELWHRIRGFALGATIVSVGAGMVIMLMEMIDHGDKIKNNRLFLVSSCLVFFIIICIVWASLIYVKKEMWHFFLYFSIFTSLAVYEFMMARALKDSHVSVCKKLREVCEYCDRPAAFAFLIIFIFLAIVDFFGINLHKDENIVPAMGAGAVGLHMLMTSIIAVLAFSRVK